ncbi:GNAT family N-acetyltransferase [Sanguibacter massiliensis]|uniref:GNAT family N-acetyltransferase n=1 Tax=Sanguibacter massiliensis TaxID=1973217 RepID=UPI000C81553F|nr:GNAT family protein [Sanguibacter massiliensis]
MTTTLLTEAWPVAALRVTEGDLELRFADDDLLLQLADLAVRGVHAPDAMPFLVPWTQGDPAAVRHGFLAYHWGARAALSPDAWNIELAVLVGGEPVGMQAVFARGFPVRRTVETGSWLGLEHQGRGIGTRMRRAVVHLAFAGLGAHDVTSEVFADNPRSQRVSEKVGYAANGAHRTSRGEEAVEARRYRLTRATWLASERPEVAIHGIEGVRRQLGVPLG